MHRWFLRTGRLWGANVAATRPRGHLDRALVLSHWSNCSAVGQVDGIAFKNTNSIEVEWSRAISLSAFWGPSPTSGVPAWTR